MLWSPDSSDHGGPAYPSQRPPQNARAPRGPSANFQNPMGAGWPAGARVTDTNLTGNDIDPWVQTRGAWEEYRRSSGAPVGNRSSGADHPGVSDSAAFDTRRAERDTASFELAAAPGEVAAARGGQGGEREDIDAVLGATRHVGGYPIEGEHAQSTWAEYSSPTAGSEAPYHSAEYTLASAGSSRGYPNNLPPNQRRETWNERHGKGKGPRQKDGVAAPYGESSMVGTEGTIPPAAPAEAWAAAVELATSGKLPIDDPTALDRHVAKQPRSDAVPPERLPATGTRSKDGAVVGEQLEAAEQVAEVGYENAGELTGEGRQSTGYNARDGNISQRTTSDQNYPQAKAASQGPEAPAETATQPTASWQFQDDIGAHASRLQRGSQRTAEESKVERTAATPKSFERQLSQIRTMSQLVSNWREEGGLGKHIRGVEHVVMAVDHLRSIFPPYMVAKGRDKQKNLGAMFADVYQKWGQEIRSAPLEQQVNIASAAHQYGIPDRHHTSELVSQHLDPDTISALPPSCTTHLLYLANFLRDNRLPIATELSLYQNIASSQLKSLDNPAVTALFRAAALRHEHIHRVGYPGVQQARGALSEVLDKVYREVVDQHRLSQYSPGDMRNILEAARSVTGEGAAGAEEFVLLELERGARVEVMGRDEVVETLVQLGALGVRKVNLADKLVQRLYQVTRLEHEGLEGRCEGMWRSVTGMDW